MHNESGNHHKTAGQKQPGRSKLGCCACGLHFSGLRLFYGADGQFLFYHCARGQCASAYKRAVCPAAGLIVFLLLQVLAVGVLFAFSPIFVGAAKLYTDIAHGRQGELSALFGWFSGKRQYGRAVAFSLSLAVRNVLWALLCFFPCGFFVVLLRIFPVVGSGPLQEGIRLLWYLFLALLILLGLTLWVVLTSRYFLAPYLFLYKEELSANTCIIQSIFLMKKNRSRYLRLVLSFLPWLLSCFFVIPALYVMPYFQTACAFSARWMLEEAGEGIP